MSQRARIEELLRQGGRPSRVSQELNLPVTLVIEQIWISIGMGRLRPADVYFSFEQDQIAFLKRANHAGNSVDEDDIHTLEECGIHIEEVELFGAIASRQIIANELYEYISEIETAVHQFIKGVLKRQFGDGEEGWWRTGIPLEIRLKCQARREEDSDPSESPFAYSDLIDLSKIIEKNWPLFKDSIDPEYGRNRKAMLSDFVILNNMRKAIMHPVKQRKWTDEDYKFIREFRERFWHLDVDGLR